MSELKTMSSTIETGVASTADGKPVIKAAAVFCGASSGNDPMFLKHAQELGEILGQRELTLVYGGASSGIMGTVANAVMATGGKVVGVMPESLFQEIAHVGLTELINAPDMSSRKAIMFDRSDCFIVLPGGFGTMDEFFEILVLILIGKVPDKPLFILNTSNFYGNLLQHLQHMETCGFIHDIPKLRKILVVLSDPQEIIPYLLTSL